jgi:elongation factor G
MGELHLDVVMRRIKEEFGVDVLVGKPQVVYKESIERTATVDQPFEKVINGVLYRGSVALSLAPNPRGQGITIIPDILSRQPEFPYITAIEEGVTEGSQMGVVKGFPLTDVRVTIHDASFNNPDFARLTLKMAAYDGFKKACAEAGPVLLVPLMSLTVTTPNEFLGEIIADLHIRKCQINDVQSQDKITIVEAKAPLTSMFGYSTDIRSLSQGRASFTMVFSHYDKVEE